VIHEIPLTQLLAFAACSAWSQGCEPDDGTYEDREIDRVMQEIKARDASKLTIPTQSWQA
jgi:hypothetical protein